MSKTLAQKFYIKPDYRLLILNAPDSFLKTQLIDLPNEVSLLTALEDSPDIIIQFSTNRSHLSAIIPAFTQQIIQSNYLWICYPKGGKKAAIPTDLNRDIVWKIMVEAGFKAVHQMSIDEVWSAVRFRVETREYPQQIV